MADLVVEDGTGKPDADAYASRQAVLDYWAARDDTAFSAATAAKADGAIRRATQFLDAQWSDRFKGARAGEAQAREWPRTGVTTSEGWLVDGVPKCIIEATAELSKMALAGPLAGSGAASSAPSQSAITSLEAGPVKISYATAQKPSIETDHGDKFYLIGRILRPVIKSGGLNRGTVR